MGTSLLDIARNPYENHDARGSRRFLCGRCRRLHVWLTEHPKKNGRLVDADHIIVCACGVRHYR
jgi:hypothetical protein